VNPAFPVDGPIRWSYALNAWKPDSWGYASQEHERALKVTSACGFRAIELRAGTGRWEPLGRPDGIEASYGSIDGFRMRIRDWGIEAVSSTFYDPGQMSFEDLHFGLDPLDPAQTDAIVAAARMHSRGLAALGGRCWSFGPSAPGEAPGAVGRPVEAPKRLLESRSSHAESVFHRAARRAPPPCAW
jgi:hypothetical protein